MEFGNFWYPFAEAVRQIWTYEQLSAQSAGRLVRVDISRAGVLRIWDEFGRCQTADLKPRVPVRLFLDEGPPSTLNKARGQLVRKIDDTIVRFCLRP